MSDVGVRALGQKVYCQWKELLRLKVLILTLEVEPHQQVSILHPLMKKWQTLILGVRAFHAELQMYWESERSSEVTWTLEPSVEEMILVQSRKTRTPGQEGRQLYEAMKTWFDEPQTPMKRL